MLFAATSAGQIIAVDAATGRGPAPEPEPLDDSSFETTEHQINGQMVIRAPARTPLTGPFMVTRVTHQVGERVAAGELLVHLRSGSLTIDVLSPIVGTLSELPYKITKFVSPGDPVALITPPASARKD
jgi:biotin carboxyl carrier protein